MNIVDVVFTDVVFVVKDLVSRTNLIPSGRPLPPLDPKLFRKPSPEFSNWKLRERLVFGIGTGSSSLQLSIKLEKSTVLRRWKAELEDRWTKDVSGTMDHLCKTH